jgi:fatty-acyl-CoA synthase
MSLHEALAGFGESRERLPCLLGLENDGSWGAVWLRVSAKRRLYAAHRGRVVAFALEDGPEAVEALLACLISGAIAFPLSPHATPHEREQLLAGLDVALVVGPEGPGGTPVEPGDYPAPGDVALLVGTSGSTGTPKRVALSYGGLAWNARAHARSLGLEEGTRTLITSPIYHAFPLVALLLGTLVVGGAVDFLSGFSPKTLFKRVEAHNIDYVALSPTSLRMLIERDKPELRLSPLMSVGAGPMPATELEAAARWAQSRGSALYHTYGLSEAGPRVATLAPADLLAGHSRSVGRPMPGVEVRIENAEGGIGEVWVRSPSVMVGYYPEGGGLAEDGWLPTGDRGRLDADGFLTLEGRLKDVMVIGGVNVSTREVEEALLADDCIVEAAVVGVPDPVYGEVGRAYVVVRGDAAPQEIMSRLMRLLSRHKLPHRIEVCAELPRTALGKVDKRRLKETACEA